jgi:hypothetical protein
VENRNQLHLSRRGFFSFLTLVVALILTPLSLASLRDGAQDADNTGDTVLEKADDFHPPVTITLIKTHIGTLKLGRKFSGGEDWFKRLTVVVRNDSVRPITYLSVKLRFPRPQGQEKELDFVEQFTYGVSPIPDLSGEVLTNTARPVRPGESIELGLTDEDYLEIKGHLKSIKYPASIKRIRLSVQMIGFDDGTVWMGGKQYVLDSANPGRLIPLEKKVAVTPLARLPYGSFRRDLISTGRLATDRERAWLGRKGQDCAVTRFNVLTDGTASALLVTPRTCPSAASPLAAWRPNKSP